MYIFPVNTCVRTEKLNGIQYIKTARASIPESFMTHIALVVFEPVLPCIRDSYFSANITLPCICSEISNFPPLFYYNFFLEYLRVTKYPVKLQGKKIKEVWIYTPTFT